MVDSFITEKSFLKSWSKFPVDFTRSQQNENQFIFSTLDHFFWNEDLDEQIIDAGVLHSSDNDSDHSPIYCVLKSQPVLAEHQNDNLAQDKPSWRKASPEERNDFQNLLNENLTAIEIPASLNNCPNVLCKDNHHCDDADKFMGEILSAIDLSASETLPSKQSFPSNRKKITPGWSDEVKPSNWNCPP